MTLKIAVVGSTDLTPVQVDCAEFLILGLLRNFETLDKGLSYEGVEVVSGGADGVDTVAENVAGVLRMQTKIFLPRYQRWEPEGFKDRNIKIAEHCDQLICVRSTQSKTYGSGWTADYAEGLNKPVWRYMV